jgi:NAD(P)-dependent dehydrogenase (short-subunit alcohol dehydrogenase family)
MTLDHSFSLQGKTALVTGAGRGIGTGIATVLAEAGATVIVNALTETHLGPFVEQLSKQVGRPVHGITGDCTTSEGAAKLAQRASELAPPVDILVNNVGDAIRATFLPLDGAGEPPLANDTIARSLDLNLMAAIYCTRAFGPGMLARKQGKVINISSLSAFNGSPHLSIYAAAKAALGGFTRSLALEWARHGVQVNAIAPGLFPDAAALGPEKFAAVVDKTRSRIPMGRVGEFREVGLLALYLASSASDYMTGQVLSIDGGMTA